MVGLIDRTAMRKRTIAKGPGNWERFTYDSDIPLQDISKT